MDRRSSAFVKGVRTLSLANNAGPWWLVVALLGLIPATCPAQPAAAPPPGQATPVSQHASIGLEVDKAAVIPLAEPATTVFVASPDIADVQIASPANVLVYGKKPGATTVFVVTQSGTESYPVSVSRPIGEVAAAIRRQVPNAQISVAGAPNGIAISGHVASPLEAEQVKTAARQFLGDKEDIAFNVTVDAATQVTLQVRVAEVSRTAEKAFGFNWNNLFNNGSIAIGLITGRTPITTGTGATLNFVPATPPNLTTNYNSVGFGFHGQDINVTSVLDALQTEGLVTILAEPNLTAISGETANFLAGGEFPFPVPQGLSQVTIEFKRYGISVDFTPTVLDGNRLSIKVRPEVSQLDTTNQITLNGVSVPGLTVRRASTTVELASGQSFAIAGLYQHNVTSSLQQFPGLGDMPILGALFRSSNFQRNESELVIIVTPYVVRPVSRPEDLHVPTEGVSFATDLERILLGRLTSLHGPSAPPAGTDLPHLHGTAGFMLE
jgi:pilus assembly protein CpaC